MSRIVEVRPSTVDMYLIKTGRGNLCQQYRCIKCRHVSSYKEAGKQYTGVWADTKGIPFVSYLCYECKDKVI